ncbi:hypothetical protein dsat_0654 [Alkalidesulfovibrio alkalitolerans DSM 16529]|jgi:hypothetical protein|uniref:Uncharacterized protein n=1 Tax=Alkalidesulfovibrio alkalitolerans DSM 16529 TaxID=1121439 RepID=S7T5L1_9BACT|nr:hypothetical protein dsat_0654 [Alkalidesulfovibrio alkalitolerans DSM 16529]
MKKNKNPYSNSIIRWFTRILIEIFIRKLVGNIIDFVVSNHLPY